MKALNAISTTDINGAYWTSTNSSFIQYCDNNIGLFSIAPPLVVALNPFA